jgi:hypothetical protein
MQPDPVQPPASQHGSQRVAALVRDRDRIPREVPGAGIRHDEQGDDAAHRDHPDGRNGLRAAEAVPQFVQHPKYWHVGKDKRLLRTG